MSENEQSVLERDCLPERPLSNAERTYQMRYFLDVRRKRDDYWVRSGVRYSCRVFLDLDHTVAVDQRASLLHRTQAYLHPTGVCVVGLCITHAVFEAAQLRGLPMHIPPSIKYAQVLPSAFRSNL
jgi:hypothetical protein